MPGVIDKIADALHIHKHHEETEEVVVAKEDVKTPVFDSDKVTVLFVLGGPGAGRLARPLSAYLSS